MSDNKQLYTVGKFAQKAGVTIRTIRYYDKRGLLKPSQYSLSGYRLYSEEEFAKLQKILTLKYLGFSLDNIQEAIKNDNGENSLKESLSIQRQILESKLSHISLIIKSIAETEKMLESSNTLEWDSFINIIKAINTENVLIEQYKNSSNLKARINIHDKYSINKYGWHKWLFDKINIPPRAKVLELGCGDGSLWYKNISCIPNDCEVFLTDISEGMIEDSKKNLRQFKDKFKFKVVDADQIPFGNATFDVIIANHMLFYVKDRKKVFSEIKRVLKQGGKLYASTVGEDHMAELVNLAVEFDNRIFFTQTNLANEFGLENGEKQLQEWFKEVNLYRYDDSLIVDEAEPLLKYINSTHGNAQEILKDRMKELGIFIENKIRSNENIFITKKSGLFEATNSK